MELIIRENFKKLRKKMSITQEQMADYLGLEQSSISKFESGERAITMSNLEKACALFGVTLKTITAQIDVLNTLAPAFRKISLSVSSLQDVANINKIAMNLLEMFKILEKYNG